MDETTVNLILQMGRMTDHWIRSIFKTISLAACRLSAAINGTGRVLARSCPAILIMLRLPPA